MLNNLKLKKSDDGGLVFEKIALRHTFNSALIAEFDAFSIEEKAVFLAVICIALKEAVGTGQPISTSQKYPVSPDPYMELLSRLPNGYQQSTIARSMVFKSISEATEALFERDLCYHLYDNNNDLIICRSRLIAAYCTSQNKIRKDQVEGVELNIGICITIELNKIIESAKGSIDKAFALTYKLLTGNNITTSK